jgi:acetyl-CoA C-acetyltransferase
MSVAVNTPILVGVGEFSERLDANDYRGLSPVELAAEAARIACNDALSVERLAKHIDVVAAIRQFEISTPRAKAPFGRSNNFPRSVANRIGANPQRAILEVAGGQGPQHLVDEIAGLIAAGKARCTLLVGAEAISTARRLASEEPKPDWCETVDGSLEDRGYGLAGISTEYQQRHKLNGAPVSYALCENARRARLRLTATEYSRQMGQLFERFTRVAARNPHAAAPEAHSAEQLITVTERNRMIADPYPRLLVSRDQVNQSAALLLTSVGVARELGIDDSKWIYLHGYADAVERNLLERPEMGSSPAAVEACRAALACAGIGVDAITYFDLYSCFPIAVFNILDGLGLRYDDPRGFTTTGGLPYFGGAGNNYSMHAIAATAARLRARPGSYALVGANGGLLSKYSVGVYSTLPTPWKSCDGKSMQDKLDSAPAEPIEHVADGPGRIETYTIAYEKGLPAYGIIVGRLETNNRRFLAITPEQDRETLECMLGDDPLGKRVIVRSLGYGNRFTFTAERMASLYPSGPKMLRDAYEFCTVERRDHLLEITINRPKALNCLHPPANEELSDIFDAYFEDPDLWVAILTGAGTDAFCTGNDLKYQASGKPVYIPKNGFGGLTSRPERDKPVIAAVNGFAMGGGFEICLACDLVVADEKAQFALSEVRVGLFAGAGGLVRLPRQIPRKQATEMILTGRRVGASEGKHLGFVNRIAPAGQALEGARQLAGEILEGSPVSVQCSIQVMNESERHANPLDALAHQTKALERLLAAEDTLEGIMAFAQKRKPQWKRR